MPDAFLPLRPLLLLACLALPFCAQAAGKCESLVATGSPDDPPYLWRDPAHPERLIGAEADLLERIGKAIGVEIRVLYAGSRLHAEDEARSGRFDLFSGAFLTTDRLERMDYVHPAFLAAGSSIWVRKDAAFPATRPEDLIGRKGVALTSQNLGPGFDAFSRQLTLERVPSLAQAFQQLLLGRSDYLIHPYYPALAALDTLGMLNDVQVLEPPVASDGLYLALAHDSACNTPWLRGQLAKKMTELTAAGVPQRLLEDNLARWKAQQLQPGGIPTQ
ncbi:Bacterial extracellular solute-binding protein, family 3 [compost metagenome]